MGAVVKLESLKPGLVYEEVDNDSHVIWLVLKLHEGVLGMVDRKNDYVTVTELELHGPRAGEVTTSTISRNLCSRYTLLEENA